MTNTTYAKTAKRVSPKKTPQSEPVIGKNQVRNNAGGYTFQITPWEQLNRFLILGSEGGSYYVGEAKLTKDNAVNVLKCINEDGKRVVDVTVEISDAGRAPKNDPALFVLAMCSAFGNADVRRYALDNLHKVARIGTHLFHFAEYVNSLRGWGHGLRRAVGNWYTKRNVASLATQLVKYQARDGWSHRDLLRLSHPKTDDWNKNHALRWAVKGDAGGPYFEDAGVPKDDPLAIIWAYEQVKKATTEKDVLYLVKDYKLPLEAIPTEKQTQAVLAQALPNMGVTALIRNLGRFTKAEILTSTTSETDFVVSKITDSEVLKKGRVHPIQVLFALSTYSSGRGFKGKNEWNVVPSLVNALDEAFYLSFGFVRPTGKRILLALDISGSMTLYNIARTNVSARVGSAAMAMITARTEKNWEIVGFSRGNSATMHWGYGTELKPLDITPRRRLDDIVKYVDGLQFGGTDCALPMVWAKEHNKEFDAFIVYTDNETWAGNIHPFQALKEYRNKTGIPARLVVAGMTSTNFSIADPSDAGMMDVVGFDTAAPNIMADFIRGEL